MRRMINLLIMTVMTLLLVWALYLIGYNAGYFASMIEVMTDELKRAFKAPQGKV